MGYPSIGDLNGMSADAFASELAPLLEGAPRFLARLAEARPYESDSSLFETAREIARTMPEAEQLELLDAHPRIGADPGSISPASYDEQGYAELSDEVAERVDEELAMLNDIYEKRFGFRYVVFVAGRPRSSIVPLIEGALRNDRQAELWRGLDDAINIAADRLRRLRGTDDEG